MRCSAISNGLDPDTALPEDIALLDKDSKGEFKIFNIAKEASRRAKFYAENRNMINENKV